MELCFLWSYHLYLILSDLCIFALVSVHLSKQSLPDVTGKDLHQLAQFGVLDKSAGSIWGQVGLLWEFLVG